MGIKTTSPKSESITFRLESQVLDKLRKKAKQERVSLNTLVNQLIVDYSDWDMTATSAGWMVMARVTIRKVFEMLNQDEIQRLADATYLDSKDAFIFMREKDDEQAFLSVLRMRMKKSGFHVRELENNGKTTFIIQHDLGRNYSLYSKALFEAILHKYRERAEFEVTDNTVIMSVYGS